MFIKNSLLQAKTLLPIYIIIFTILLGLLSSVFIVAIYYDIPVAWFTRDPTVILKGHPFVGIISNIGIIFWCFTAAICFFSSAIHLKKKNTEVFMFLLFSGLLTFWLLLDDLFMFHDSIFPLYFHLPEEATYSGYIILTTIYFVKFRRLLLKTEYITLCLACGFFALSLSCDVFLPNKGMEYLVEDGLKLFGIVTWFIYFIRTCFTHVQLVMNR